MISHWVRQLRLGGILLAALLTGYGIANAQEAVSSTEGYQVNAGDVLIVSVWKEQDLQQQVLVRPDGRFTFPLAGEIQAEGRTIAEIQATLTERLTRYIPDPVATVSALEIRGNKIYVLGQVNRPGEFLVNPNVDVMQALSMAGGTTPFAQLDDIKVLRREGQTLSAIPFEYSAVAKGKRLQQNIMLEAGDVVVVP